MNKAKKPWPADRRIDLVLEGLSGHRPVKELCHKAGISPASYYQWRRQFIDAARSGLTHPEVEHRMLKERVEHLEVENASLQRQVRILRELCVAD